jgi:adenylate kinase
MVQPKNPFVGVVIVGKPGSGKTTEGKMLAEEIGADLYDVGKMFRWEVQNNTQIGTQAGPFMRESLLVPTDLVNKLVYPHLESSFKRLHPFVLVGVPRDLHQAEEFECFVYHSKCVLITICLNADDETACRRIVENRKKSEEKREDDETIKLKKRLIVFQKVVEAMPILRRRSVKFVELETNGKKPKEVHGDVWNKIGSFLCDMGLKRIEKPAVMDQHLTSPGVCLGATV